MSLTPKLKKKSKVRTWFHGIARETLEGETVPFREIRVTVQQQVKTTEREIVTVKQFVRYLVTFQIPNRIWRKLEPKVSTPLTPLEVLMQKNKQMEIQACERDRARDAETLALRKEIQAMEQKV